jgi:8-oxo-dGTP pyrophosphatase MutT (NUDIX family)
LYCEKGIRVRVPFSFLLENALTKITVNPELLPIDAIAGEPALPLERLQADWLRQHFAEPPPWKPEAGDEALVRHLELRRASVLIPLVVRPEGLMLLLTQRTAHLSSHGGQISFPGGGVEASDTSPVDTALRETEEEIGLHRSKIEVIGTMPDYITGTRYRITPVVGLIEPPFALQADPNEVAEIFEVPLAFLMDGVNHLRLSYEMPEGLGRRRFYAMRYERFFIWGATAGMLRNLFHFLRA